MLVVLLAAVMVAQNPVAGESLSPRPHAPAVKRSADATVLGAIGAVDANELEAAKLAATKASASEVRDLATMLVKDHERSLDEGARLAKRFKIERLLPADSAMARAHVEEMAQLNTLTAAAFDLAFVEYTLADHKAVITKINTTLLATAQRPQVKAFVQSLLAQLTTHQKAEEKWLAEHP
jgi:predicted outer membrane protein